MPAFSPEASPYIEASMPEDGTYPWVTHTPEHSPRWQYANPGANCAGQDLQAQPQMLSLSMLRLACEPYFEQMMCNIDGHIASTLSSTQSCLSQEKLASLSEPFFVQMVISLQQTTKASPDLLQVLCRPFFQQMVASLHKVLQQRIGNKPRHNLNGGWHDHLHEQVDIDEASTEAFSSLFSGPSSEGEGPEAAERGSDVSSDVEKSVMVCRHWRSKGWCRLEDKCKFLHPEHKRGVGAVKGCCATTISVADLASTQTASQRRRRRGGKGRQQEFAAMPQA
jgi:hypothetical protein